MDTALPAICFKRVVKNEKKQLDLWKYRESIIAFCASADCRKLIEQLYTTVDAIIVGQFTGKVGLASIDSVHTLFKFPINFMNGLATGATIMISGYFGAKDKKGLHCAVRTALLLSRYSWNYLCSSGIIFSPWLLKIMSVPKEIHAEALIYCRIYMGGIWAMILYNMMAVFCVHSGIPKILYMFCCMQCGQYRRRSYIGRMFSCWRWRSCCGHGTFTNCERGDSPDISL